MNARLPSLVRRHLWLKIVALALAVVTRVYVDNELRQPPPAAQPTSTTARP